MKRQADMMKALITGASSGLGRDMARVLHAHGCALILVARREERLLALQEELAGGDVRIICMDLSLEENCYRLYDRVKEEKIDILINNAGFGICGAFLETELDTELRMLRTNITAPQILTKLFLQDFVRRDSGYLLNVASSAAFLPGPLMATYYATKAYLLRFSQSIYEELQRENSRVSVSVLCPGPVDTEFNTVAEVNFQIKSLNSHKVAEYAIKQMFRKKLVIVPGLQMKLLKFFIRFAPDWLLLRISYHIQHRKNNAS